MSLQTYNTIIRRLNNATGRRRQCSVLRTLMIALEPGGEERGGEGRGGEKRGGKERREGKGIGGEGGWKGGEGEEGGEMTNKICQAQFEYKW